MAEPGSTRIVLAEDCIPDVILVKETLRAAGIEVELKVFSDGEECVRYLISCEEPPHAIILDLNLPRVDGFELLRVVRSERRYAGVPVAVLTSSRAAEDRQRSLDLGANAFITKPSKLDDFLQTVGSAIRRLLGATGSEAILRATCPPKRQAARRSRTRQGRFRTRTRRLGCLPTSFAGG